MKFRYTQSTDFIKWYLWLTTVYISRYFISRCKRVKRRAIKPEQSGPQRFIIILNPPGRSCPASINVTNENGSLSSSGPSSFAFSLETSPPVRHSAESYRSGLTFLSYSINLPHVQRSCNASESKFSSCHSWTQLGGVATKAWSAHFRETYSK